MASGAREGDPSRLRPGALALLAGAVVALGSLEVLPRWAGLPHLVALPPLDIVTDLGGLLVRAPSWPWLVGGVVASVVVRSAVLASLLGGVDRERFLYAVRFYVISLPLAFLAAAGVYGAGALLFYALFWFGTALGLVLVLFFGAAPWMASTRLRTGFARAARHGFRAGTVGAYLAGLTLVGVVADLGGPVAAVLMVPVSAALTYLAAQALRRDPGWRPTRRAVAAAALAGLVALTVVAATGPAGPPEAPPPEDPQDGSIMLMSGVDSSSGNGAILEIDPHVMGWTCDRTYYFSYAGPGDGQPRRAAACAISHGAPYEEEDTLRSREELVPFLEQQVSEMDPPGVVAGHSQGVWLLWQAAAERRLPGVEAIVLVGPFPENPVSYPREGQRAPGGAGRRLLDVFATLPRPGGTTVFRPASPLSNEWLGHPDAIEDTLARPLPEGIRALSIPSVFDLPLIDDHRIEGAAAACPVPVIHPNLPYSIELQEAVSRFARGERPQGCSGWRRWVGPLFRHFAVLPSGE